MDENGTVAAGNVGPVDDDVIIGEPADCVDADFERINGPLIHKPMIGGRRHPIRRVLNHRVRPTFMRGEMLFLNGKSLKTAAAQKLLPRSAEVIAPREVEVNTVQMWVIHDQNSETW